MRALLATASPSSTDGRRASISSEIAPATRAVQKRGRVRHEVAEAAAASESLCLFQPSTSSSGLPELIVLVGRGDRAKAPEILVLGHERRSSPQGRPAA